MTVTRQTTRRSLMAAGLIGALAAAHGAPATAQGYPAEDTRWIIYQSPGGLIDSTSRAIQPYLDEQGFSTTLDYVRGASGRIARTELFRSGPSGYTIMTEASPEEVLGQIVYGADYEVSELQPVYGWFVNSFNLYVPKDSDIEEFKDFVETAGSNTVTVGTIGRGGPSHLQLAILADRLDLDLRLVHFDGGSAAYTALSGGHVDAAIGGSSSVRWSDTIDFLTVFAEERDRALPDTPTIAELGHDVTPIHEVIYVHTGPEVPAERVQALSDAFAAAFQNPKHIEQQNALGVYPTLLDAGELRGIIDEMSALVEEHKAALTQQ